ncbi:NlpC/P60 family protein [Solidesulfovibrio carbinolicus]|uniref:Uncharacterized protein n=1 Tax=Solidesulfovibrio carbinolicus TaxID=296842 RepID=A0A4P6HLA9_9BACT|nr:NlpC/P60 family protein [Solidesulfovibrio carbinolicus]QAZ67466.1 hypothetical protein C3Y92_09615 [Solidesulfovibrio carbinolicus]
MGLKQNASTTSQPTKQQPITPSDPNLLTPATRGTIGNNREAWPAAFINVRGDTFLTATKFHGLDAGFAKFSGPGQPVQAVDIGIRDRPAAQQQAIAADLSRKIERAPIMLQSVFTREGPVSTPCEVVSGNPNTIKVRPLPGFDAKGIKVAFMDPETFKKAMEGLEKDIAALPLQKVPKIQPGEKGGDWLDNSINSSINQAIDGLKAKGYPYAYGGRADLDGKMDCSAFVSAMMKRVGKNVNESAGKAVFDKFPQGCAADMVTTAMQRGGRITPQELLKNPRPGCMIGLDTGNKGWDKGRANGIDHVAMTFRDKSGKMMVAEYTPDPKDPVHGSGLKVTEMDKFINRYTAKGSGIFIATPESLCNKAALASANAKAVAALEFSPAAEAGDDAHARAMAAMS